MNFVKSFSEILLQKHREIQIKNDFLDKFRRIESELSYCKAQNDKILLQKNCVEKELKNCLNKYALLEKNTKEQMFLLYFLSFFCELMKFIGKKREIYRGKGRNE